MSSLPQSEMLAVLLSLVGKDASTAALQGMPEATLQQVKATMEEFESQPPTQDEVEYVVDDFVKYFRFAMKTVDNQLEDEGSSGGTGGSGTSSMSADKPVPARAPAPPVTLQIAEEDFEVELEPVKKFLPLALTGDHIQDLTRLHPYQVAYAIRDEKSVTIALVIRNLATEHAAKTLEFLPDSLRPAVFLQLAQPSNVSDFILEKVMATTVQRAMKVEKRETITDAAEQMVTLIRSVPKDMRAPMLEELQKTDEELSGRVKDQMYQFEDLSSLDNKDLQQVLGQTNTDSLALALQNVEQDLVDKILGNMSKRARESFAEELEFKKGVKQDEIDAGRAEVVRVLIELDEAGTISLG